MDEIIDIVNRSNQRGGRMLSVIDLIEAETLARDQAAWLIGRMLEGASWMVGAKPGGAGKTTIMGALLAMLPGAHNLYLTNPETRWREAGPGDCVVCYEISPGSYDAYIWGEDVARLVELASQGCRVVTNLHANTITEAREQIVGDCGADADLFPTLDLFLPIRLADRRPFVPRAVQSDGASWALIDTYDIPDDKPIEGFLQDAADRGLRTVEDVRRAWLDWLGEQSKALFAAQYRKDNTQ